jgi:ABC-type cobalamin/Fe3+-siderophores transport system ATPase subunit
MLNVCVDDQVRVSLLDGGESKDTSELSTGQRCTAILPVLLRHQERVLVMDQPEDNLDNAFIVETLVKAILARPKSSQLIVTTHNANIPVIGDAANVILLASTGRRGFVDAYGPLDEPNIVEAISRVMEGGREAFQRRAEFYGSTPSA